MTNIDTDNPIIQFRVWCYDFIWLYLPFVALFFIIAVILIYQYFTRRQKRWEAHQREIEAKTKEVYQLRERARNMQANGGYLNYRSALEELTHAELDIRELKKRKL